MARAVTKRTIVVAGSAPGFPHGIIDPIPELSDMARERGVGFHTDACLGGFVLPWAERLGYEVADRIHIHRLGRRLCVVKPGNHSMSEAVAMMTGAMEPPAEVQAA